MQTSILCVSNLLLITHTTHFKPTDEPCFRQQLKLVLVAPAILTVKPHLAPPDCTSFPSSVVDGLSVLLCNRKTALGLQVVRSNSLLLWDDK